MTSPDVPFRRLEGELHCGSFSVRDLADRFGTPLYLYNFDFIRERYRAFREAFSGQDLLIAYSVKANGNVGLLSRLASLGAGADIVSGGELYRVLRGGIPAGRIVFAGVGKSDLELKAGLDARIHAFHVETASELHRLEALAREAGVRAPFGVRINPDILSPTPHEYTRTGHADSKFGLPVPVAVGLYRWAATRPSLRIRGIDVHIGSQIVDPAPYKQALRMALDVVRLLKKEGIRLEYVDLGGGFGIPYEGAGMDLGALAGSLMPLLQGMALKLILEPGRSLVGEAGLLVTRVAALKKSGGKTFVITDAGMTELLRPSHYGGYHGVLPVGPGDGREAVRVDVVGPVCEAGDFLARDREMPLPQEGDLLGLENVGAYGFTMASNYNGRCRPAEVLVDGAEVSLVRRREAYEDLVRGEIIP